MGAAVCEDPILHRAEVEVVGEQTGGGVDLGRWHPRLGGVRVRVRKEPVVLRESPASVILGDALDDCCNLET